MDATHHTGPRRLTAGVLSLTAAGVLAGATGGYLLRATTSDTQRLPAPALVAPATRAEHPLNADSRGGYRDVLVAGAPARPLNADPMSGYP